MYPWTRPCLVPRTGKLVEAAESNPRPQAVHLWLYMLRRLIELRFPTPSRVQFTVPVAVELASMQRSPSPGNSIFVTLLSRVFSFDRFTTRHHPTGRAANRRASLDLTTSSEAVDAASLCESTPGVRTHKHVTVRGWQLLKPPERSRRRWQLCCCGRIYEDSCILGMHLGFRHLRRSHVAPDTWRPKYTV